MSTKPTNDKARLPSAPASGSVDGLIETIKEIKKTALQTTDAGSGLAHIVRLCIDAEKATRTWVRIDQRKPSPPNAPAYRPAREQE